MGMEQELFDFILVIEDLIAQLVESTGIAEVMGLNPIEALIFFRLLLSNCLNWKINCYDHSSLSTWVVSLISSAVEMEETAISFKF